MSIRELNSKCKECGKNIWVQKFGFRFCPHCSIGPSFVPPPNGGWRSKEEHEKYRK